MSTYNAAWKRFQVFVFWVRLKMRKSKYLPAIILWILAVTALVIFTSNDLPNTTSNETTKQASNFRVRKNQLGGFSCIQRDHEQNNRPIYTVRFENLTVENNTLGFFKTALHKIAKVDDLQLNLFQYTTASGSFDPLDIFASQTTTRILEKLTLQSNGWAIDTDIHLNNISEILIRDFSCSVFNDNDLAMNIKSKTATASYKHDNFLLRGHVRIKNSQDSLLKSNHVEWDIKNDRFIVKGIYALRHNGIVTTGRNICLSTQFKHIENPQNITNNQKEVPKCVALLQ